MSKLEVAWCLSGVDFFRYSFSFAIYSFDVCAIAHGLFILLFFRVSQMNLNEYEKKLQAPTTKPTKFIKKMGKRNKTTNI